VEGREAKRRADSKVRRYGVDVKGMAQLEKGRLGGAALEGGEVARVSGEHPRELIEATRAKGQHLLEAGTV
jgi:hypothetical protein